jgi:hypothetical protein
LKELDWGSKRLPSDPPPPPPSYMTLGKLLNFSKSIFSSLK